MPHQLGTVLSHSLWALRPGKGSGLSLGRGFLLPLGFCGSLTNCFTTTPRFSTTFYVYRAGRQALRLEWRWLLLKAHSPSCWWQCERGVGLAGTGQPKCLLQPAPCPGVLGAATQQTVADTLLSKSGGAGALPAQTAPDMLLAQSPCVPLSALGPSEAEPPAGWPCCPEPHLAGAKNQSLLELGHLGLSLSSCRSPFTLPSGHLSLPCQECPPRSCYCLLLSWFSCRGSRPCSMQDPPPPWRASPTAAMPRPSCPQ